MEGGKAMTVPTDGTYISFISTMEIIMNKDQIEGNWEQLKGSVRKQWGKLTDDQVAQIKGDRQKLSGQIQEAYGVAKEEAEKQIKSWERACCDKAA